jgi:hypothetical protein
LKAPLFRGGPSSNAARFTTYDRWRIKGGSQAQSTMGKAVTSSAKAARLKKDQWMQRDDNIGFLYMLGIVAVCLFTN